MGGGHFNNMEFVVYDNLKTICNDFRFKQTYPKLSNLLYRLADGLEGMLQRVDTDLSGDMLIPNPKKYEEDQIKKLRSLFKEES